MEFVKYELDGHIGIITIDRPNALNALNTQTILELGQVLDQIEKSKSLRCLIVTGSGEKSFVAGADIKEMQNMKPEEALAFSQKAQKLSRRFEVLQVPSIAAVNGYALGGGLEMAMSCDFIYASENARFGLPEVTLGLMPGFGGTQRLMRYVGMARAKELTYTAGQMKADEALRCGLANKVFPLSQLMIEAKKTAHSIANLAPIAISASKGAIQQGYDLGIDPGLHLERTLFSELFRSQDAKTGMSAFINKVKAVFVGE